MDVINYHLPSSSKVKKICSKVLRLRMKQNSKINFNLANKTGSLFTKIVSLRFLVSFHTTRCQQEKQFYRNYPCAQNIKISLNFQLSSRLCNTKIFMIFSYFSLFCQHWNPFTDCFNAFHYFSHQLFSCTESPFLLQWISLNINENYVQLFFLNELFVSL